VLGLVNQKLEKNPVPNVTFGGALRTLLIAFGFNYINFSNIISANSNVALDVRVQGQSDLDLAVETIVNVRKQMGIGVLYIPVASKMTESLKARLKTSLIKSQFERIEFVESPNGFYDGGAFNLELFLSKISQDRLKNTFMAVQNEYTPLSSELMTLYKELGLKFISLHKLISGILQAVEVSIGSLENIAVFARAAAIAA
jgi:hypothetical protein